MSTALLSRNAAFSLAQVVVSTFLLFVLYRYLVKNLGVSSLGLWSLVLATTSASRVAEMGLAASVVRMVATSLAARSPERAVRTVVMAFASIAVVLGLVTVALYPLFAWLLRHWIRNAADLNAGLALLPYALASFWLSGLASVFLSALDGCQRMAARSVVAISAQAVFVAVAIALVDIRGLDGLAVAQVVQAGLLLIASAFVAARFLPLMEERYMKWSWPEFMEMWRYGANVQVSGVAQLFFEPVTKALLTTFGDLEATGYFELANRLVVQVRGMVVSAFRALIPAVADLHSRRPGDLKPAYLRAHALLSFLITPLFPAISGLLPLVSVYFMGRVEPTFLMFGWLICLGWAVNTTNATAYFSYLAIGRLRWNTVTHVGIGVTNVLLAGLLGHWFGAMGVVAGSMAALAIGSLAVPTAFHREHGIGLALLVPPGSRVLMLVSISGALAVGFLALFPIGKVHVVLAALFEALMVPLILIPLLAKNPMSIRTWELLCQGLRRPASQG